jgi:flagellar protein FlaG
MINMQIQANSQINENITSVSPTLVSVEKKESIPIVDVSRVIEATATKPSDIEKNTSKSRNVIEKAAEQLQQFVQSMGRDLNFSVDSLTGYNIVRVVDSSTGELIRQLPSEELLRLAKSMETLKNVLVSQKA